MVSFVNCLFGNIASSGLPRGFSQQSGKDGDGDGRSPCGASSVPSSWHGTARTGLLPGQRGFTTRVLITSLSATTQKSKTGDFQAEKEGVY